MKLESDEFKALLINVARKTVDYLVAHGPCDDSDETGYCERDGCEFCDMARAADAVPAWKLEN